MNRRQDRQFLFVALMFLGVAGVTVQYVPGAAALNRVIGRAIAPAQRMLSGAAARAHDSIAGTHDIAIWQGRVAALEGENARLKTDNLRLTSLEREVRSLRDALSFKTNRPDLDLMGASIIGTAVAREPGHLVHAIKLDVGRKHGADMRMTVASPHGGLVGQVVRAGDYWCDVLLISDPSSAIAGRIDRSREAGMVFGSPTGELVMRYIPQDHPDTPSNVQPGDLVYTSGQSERFPPQILIGQVIEVRQNDFDTFQEALIRPTVDFNALETVLIVTEWQPQADEAIVTPP